MDVLVGGNGDDMLSGGSGADVFVFANGFGTDVITDFTQALGDMTDLTSVSAISSFPDLMRHHLSTDVNGDAVISAGLNMVTLTGVHAADLMATDFLI